MLEAPPLNAPPLIARTLNAPSRETHSMPTNTAITELLEKLAEQRRKAVAVLESLLCAREECASHNDQYHREDAVREITGVSSIDRAIESTRRIIEAIDHQLVQLTGPATA